MNEREDEATKRGLIKEKKRVPGLTLGNSDMWAWCSIRLRRSWRVTGGGAGWAGQKQESFWEGEFPGWKMVGRGQARSHWKLQVQRECKDRGEVVFFSRSKWDPWRGSLLYAAGEESVEEMWKHARRIARESSKHREYNSPWTEKGHALFSDGRKEVGMGTGVGRDLWRAADGKWSELIPSGPKFIRERRAKHLLREREKGWGPGESIAVETVKDMAVDRCRRGPAHLGDLHLWCPKLQRGVMSTPQRSFDEQRKSAGVAWPLETVPVSVLYRISITSFSKSPELPCIHAKASEALLMYV